MIATLFTILGTVYLRLAIIVRIVNPMIRLRIITPENSYKVIDSLVQLTYYSFVSFCMAQIVFSDYFQLFAPDLVSSSLILSIQLGYYLQALFTENGKDFTIMITHHIVTMLLILFSKYTAQENFGVAICLLHDCSDPFMHTAKLLNYTGKYPNLRDVVFGLFAIIFITTRLFVAPFLILEYYYNTGFDVGLVGLVCLQVMHVYWSSLIVKLAWKVFHGQEIIDDD